ncbi:MAG: peptidoglycan-binding protein [Eubacteriales bacterium]
MPALPYIPEFITVHLGPPDSDAPNVTIPYIDYIKNVASSEIFPTWPEAAIRANILAQNSVALNRVYTEFYTSQGYPFQITNDTSIDQAYVHGRQIYDNISQIVDEIFSDYIKRQQFVEPLFALYCDGVEVACEGLSQWGTTELANQGLGPYDILTRYYGDNIELVRDAPVQGLLESTPIAPLTVGSRGDPVRTVQIRLNRISNNYPAIPKINPVDGLYGPATKAAVTAFQEIFGLTPDGIVGDATWYRILYIYNAVKRLGDLGSEGLLIEDLPRQFTRTLREGDAGLDVIVLQYYLSYIAQFLSAVRPLDIDGSFGPNTTQSVKDFQALYGLPVTGVVNEATWDRIYQVYLSLLTTVPLAYREGVVVPFPGNVLRFGMEGADVLLLQNYLNYIARIYPEIPTIPATGYFGNQTQGAVEAFQNTFGLAGTPGVVDAALWHSLTRIYDDLFRGSQASTGQFPGNTIS